MERTSPNFRQSVRAATQRLGLRAFWRWWVGELAPLTGGSCLVKATSPESTLGTGQNTVRGTGPARRACANQAILTEGTP